MLNEINLYLFIQSFCIGIFFVYIVTPKKKIIHKFPSPNNVDSLVYSNNDNTCYKYETEEINCKNTKVELQPHVDELD